MDITLAIFSPNKNVYSETFIQAHKKLPFNIKYYYGDALPVKLEEVDDLFTFNFKEKINIRLNKDFSLSEHALLNSLRRENVQCVLAEYGPCAVATLKVVKHLGIPMIVHFHGYDASVNEIVEEYKLRYNEVFQYASTIVAVSTKMKEALIRLGCPEKKINVLIYGPENMFFDIEPVFSADNFICVGRFVEKKAPYITILAFSKVLMHFPKATLTMVGNGELMWLCVNLINTLKLGNNVRLAGIKSPGEIALLFSESIAFLQHSVVATNGDSEGTPVAIIEAQAAGLPVISTRHAGIPDVVIDNETGFLVEEFDLDDMVEKMLILLNNKTLGKSMGISGRKNIQENYTQEKNLSLLADLVRDSIQSNLH